MGIIKTKGIIISENNMGDFDKMLTMLTPGIGKISCAAKGARRPRSLLLGGTQLLCFGDYILYKGANSYQINSCDTIEVFYPIRTDLDKLKYAIHVTKIISDVTTENQNSYKILQLFLNTLYVISEKDMDYNFVLSIFKLRLLTILGFTPQTQKCSSCDNENLKLNYFSIRENGFICDICAKQDTSSINMSNNTKSAIEYIIGANIKKIYSFNIPDEDKKELSLISKLYLNEKLEREYKLEELF